VYDGSKVKRFKSRDGAKAYAEKNGGKVASSEFYADKIQKQGVAEGVGTGEYSRVLQALDLYYPRLSMEELNVPEFYKVIADKANVPVQYAAQVINDFVKANEPDDDEEWSDDEQDVAEGYNSQMKSKEEAIAYARDKVKTFRDSLDGIEIWKMPDGGYDVVHTMNSNGRNHTIRNGGKKIGTIYQSKKSVDEAQQCPECGGAAYDNEMLAEEKDACYSKVKSRYKVWPSAYASGALVKCRKVGAKNWGNKSKK
jgi:hypothetical protein